MTCEDDTTMKECIMTLKPVLAAALAGLLLASCTAHGQQPSRAALPEIADRPHWKVFRSHSSHNAALFKSLVSGRAFVFENSSLPDAVEGQLILEDGSVFWCFFGRVSKSYSLAFRKLSFETHTTGAALTLRSGRKVGRSLVFYDPKAGTLREEYLASHDDPHKRHWVKFRSGWVQKSWPRVLADACPAIKLPKGMEISEKQTSLKLSELRRQDPDAPIRNFPGSQHTGPGRTGLAASGGKPTTSKEDVEAWMKAQEGNILVSSRGNGYVFTEGWGQRHRDLAGRL